MEIPDLNDIRIFAAIGQEGTMTAAARNLNLPTSTVSRALTRLEKNLDVSLAQRNPRGLTLTDFGKDYLLTCRRALRLLRDGSEILESRRKRPGGVIKIACPVTMARSFFAPLLAEFLQRYPDLRIEIEPYAGGWDQEPREDIDVYFKVRAPRDSVRKVRAYPGTKRGLFASPEYIKSHGSPVTPDDLTAHTCIGSSIWKLSRGSKVSAPNCIFRVQTSDPDIHLQLAINGFGIAVLPLWMARGANNRNRLVPVLPLWSPEPITLCALFSGPARLTPKVQVLLDFLGDYIGTDKDPRLQKLPAKGMFTSATLIGTSGP